MGRIMTDVVIDGESLKLEDVVRVAYGGAKVALAAAAVPKVERARAYVERLLADHAVVYGVTTGFGKFAEVPVAAGGLPGAAAQPGVQPLLRRRAIRSAWPETRAMMLLRANVLAKGYSGVRLDRAGDAPATC